VDYSAAYPNAEAGNLGLVSYAQLKSGQIEMNGKQVKTAPLSSYAAAREIAGELKKRIAEGRFLLGQPSQLLPSASHPKRR